MAQTQATALEPRGDTLAKSGTSIHKREKEKARVQNRIDKDARKADARERRSKGRDSADGEDPDLAGIVAGPQPVAPEFADGDAAGTADK